MYRDSLVVKMIKMRARGPGSKLKVKRQVKGGMRANQVLCQPNGTWDPWQGVSAAGDRT